MTDHRLHFTIGPVQGFVAQSRRTRDLWAGSWLLSWLSGHAMRAVLDRGGRLRVPAVDKGQLDRLLQKEHAALPNRFVAAVDDPQAAAEAAENAFHAAWHAIANAVWDKFVAPVADEGQNTRAIWDRQVNHFWELAWVVGDDSALLDRRKNWRGAPATIEPGDHCTMMGRWQELSGYVRAQQREEQNTFWQRMRNQVGQLDLREDARLCAIALIKRLFSKVLTDVTENTWDAVHWPSTLYMAAVPWLKQIHLHGPEPARGAAQAYAGAVKGAASGALGERHQRIASLKEAKQTLGDFVGLDGNFFLDTALANDKATPLNDERARDGLRRELRALYGQLSRDGDDGKPSPYYALLLMDGDKMGALLRDAEVNGKLDDASGALLEFARQVPEIVADHDGLTIYAGGDDVLAMVSLPRALDCAGKLADTYQAVFRNALADEALTTSATLSGAIVYAHYHVPLRTVLDEAHRLLDGVAKAQTGRASLAAAVYKPSGLAAEWSVPWAYLRNGGEQVQTGSGETILDAVKKRIPGAPDAQEREGALSASFLYNVRERFTVLTDREAPEPGRFGRLAAGFDEEALREVLTAEYLVGKKHEKEPDKRAEQRRKVGEAITALLAVSQRVRRDADGRLQRGEQTLGLDGAMLARFLAAGGKEVSR